jgi:hypothetical protein
MRFEIVIFLITAFFMYDAYNDGKFMKMLKSGKKYYQMAFYGVLGLGIYLMLKRNPQQSKQMLLCANNMVKYLPISRSSIDMISPILDFTDTSVEKNVDSDFTGQFMNSFNRANGLSEQRILSSGKGATKRSVSETKKKYVASQQGWKCGHCGCSLNAWFEVDHKVRLEHGGGNDVSNLVALCRECHGKKTAMENM